MRRTLLLLPIGLAGLAAIPTPPGDRDALDFRFDVLPILQRQGCASAYCHGSATGRGGFKLSLFGSDARADHRAITRDLDGRRVDLRNPDDSLVLRKPTMQTKHGGGRKLREGEAAHTAMRNWIDQGAPYRQDDGRELIDLSFEVGSVRLKVTAHFRDAAGKFERDVTDLASFESSDERVVAIDTAGRMTTHGKGRAFVLARYVGRTARLEVRQPFTKGISTEKADHVLDAAWLASLAELGLRPATAAPARVIARRLYLDLVDRLPTPGELRDFLALPEATRTETTARKLVATRAFAERFGRELGEWLEIPTAEKIEQKRRLFTTQRARLVTALHRGDSLHSIARRLLVEDRRLIDRFNDPRDRAELVSRALLGVRIGCARCHDSPVDRWVREDNLGFSALFVSARPSGEGSMKPGILFHPENGDQVKPRILPVKTTGTPPSAASHRETAAWFVLAAGHGMFERNVANRVFKALIGRGLVEPVDDHRLSNPARHEKLLDTMAEAAKQGDLRKLVLLVVTSRLYAATSDAGSANDRSYFARREPRSMASETFLVAVASALGHDRNRASRPLPSSPLARQLALLNGDFLHTAVDRAPMLEGIISFAPDAETLLNDIFTLLLSRPPRPAESAKFLPRLTGDKTSAAARDLAYALLASREFGSIR